eukprot:8030348-Lingulodinium_polyedra.AAC.1
MFAWKTNHWRAQSGPMMTPRHTAHSVWKRQQQPLAANRHADVWGSSNCPRAVPEWHMRWQ